MADSTGSNGLVCLCWERRIAEWTLHSPRIICENVQSSKKSNIHIDLLREWVRDENTWLRAASVVRRRKREGLLLIHFFCVRCCALRFVCVCTFLVLYVFLLLHLHLHLHLSLAFAWTLFFLVQFSVHWRLLSLFNMRALEPIRLVVCVCLHSHSVVCWLIYHFDYWPLYALAEICWSSDAVRFLVNRAPKSLKPHDQPAKEKTKRQSHGRTKLEAASFFLMIACRLLNFGHQRFYRINRDEQRAKCSRREKNRNTHTRTTHLMTDILSADVILKQNFWNSTKFKGWFAFT